MRADSDNSVPDLSITTECMVKEQAGDRIGRYKLLEKIGEGGWGVVYMAQQSEPLRRLVALKIVKLGMDTRQVIARFESERQALALMDHPNIARVFDAGATDGGRPYFVMELVKGVRITEYCDQHNLSTRERLDLFIQVCQAVQHAHQKGIIHRDLKPSNILVTQLDGVAVPKVIDFGIAKSTQQPLTDKTMFTAFRQFIGTPAYMSPEQADLSGADIDTRSDIYSLGVLLYELLTERTPFERKSLDELGFDELRRLIREKEPVRPSTRLRTLAPDELTTVARHQRTEPPGLLHQVRGDLDWIVMKCLEKDRARRYASAAALAADLDRHLRDKPVEAVAPSALYLLTKFARRHRQAVGAAAALLLLLIAGLVWQAAQLNRASRQAKVLAKFLENTFKSVRASVAAGRDPLLLKEVLDEAAMRVETELKDQAVAQASVKMGIGFIYVDLKEYPKAERAFAEAREQYERTYGLRSAGTAASMFGLSLVSLKEGRYAEAESRARRALELGRKAFDKEATVLGHCLNVLAAALEAQNQLEEAEARGREALAIARRLEAQEEMMVANSVATLGRVQAKQGRWREAELLLREAVARRTKLLGPGNPEVNELVQLLARSLREQGRLEEEALVLREAGQPSDVKRSD